MSDKTGRRAREADGNRRAVRDSDRKMVREIVLECEARLDSVMAAALRNAGIADANLHRRQHEDWGLLSPELKDVLLPYVREKYLLTKKWSGRLDKMTDQVIMWVVGAGMLFMLYCVYYGATEAIAKMAN